MTTAPPYFLITKQDIQDVRKIFNKKDEDVKQDLEILREWLRKQSHLPQNIDDRRLECMLLKNKFRIEQTKRKLDNYYTLHGIYPEVFEEIKNNFEDILKHGKQMEISVSPVLTDTYERIVYSRICDKDTVLDVKKLLGGLFLFHELQFSYDYSVGERFIVDWSNVTLSHYKTMSSELNLLLKSMALHQDAYSARIMGIENINVPNHIDVFLNFFKMILNAKIFSKIRVHKTMDDLYQIVDRKYLPSDLGGSLKSAKFYQKALDDNYLIHKDEILANIQEVSNEKLRIGKPYESHLHGVDGTFKKLTID